MCTPKPTIPKVTAPSAPPPPPGMSVVQSGPKVADVDINLNGGKRTSLRIDRKVSRRQSRSPVK